MTVEAIVEKEGVCLRLRNPVLKLKPEDRPFLCGDCYDCGKDPIRNPGCPGNPRNYKENAPENFIG